MTNISHKSIAVAISAIAFSATTFAQLEEVLVTAQKRGAVGTNGREYHY